MSLLRGDADSTWSLPGSVDALAAAARQASRPGTIWLAGLSYQFVILGWTFGSLVARPILGHTSVRGLDEPSVRIRPLHGMEDVLAWVQRDGLGAALAASPLVLVLFRLAGGLAKLSPPDAWSAAAASRVPRWWNAWRSGKGTTVSAVGLWLLFVLMMFAATVLFAAPTHLLLATVRVDALSPLTAIVSGVTIGFLLVYSFLLSILFQLGLHSLVQNRRGAASALQHAWRSARNDPMATARATVVDAVLYLTVIVPYGATVGLQKVAHLHEALLLPLQAAILGFGGCARCAFWARAYRALGGISTLSEPAGAERTARA